MSKDERFDIVVVGGGPNGMTTAAYLAKCGLRVCVLEERTECGGACETQEPIPGVRIYPHAMLMYASPAPGFEQLEEVFNVFLSRTQELLHTISPSKLREIDHSLRLLLDGIESHFYR